VRVRSWTRVTRALFKALAPTSGTANYAMMLVSIKAGVFWVFRRYIRIVGAYIPSRTEIQRHWFRCPKMSGMTISRRLSNSRARSPLKKTHVSNVAGLARESVERQARAVRTVNQRDSIVGNRTEVDGRALFIFLFPRFDARGSRGDV
jgi:hypothetical protein